MLHFPSCGTTCAVGCSVHVIIVTVEIFQHVHNCCSKVTSDTYSTYSTVGVLHAPALDISTTQTRVLVLSTVHLLTVVVLYALQVKLLVNHIVQSDSCGKSCCKASAEDSLPQVIVPRHQEGGDPNSVMQLNGSATDRTESFELENADEVSMAKVFDASARNPQCTQRLFVDFVQTLTKHMMHWAASNRVAVDTVLWECRVLGYGGGRSNGDNRPGSMEGQEGGRAMGTPARFTVQAKGLCDRAASVLLDGVDRTPSSWRCLINYAQLVLKSSIAILETALAKEKEIVTRGSMCNDRCGPKAAEEMERIDHLEGTLVGVLLPPLVNGLLPFAHLSVFARRFMEVVTSVLRLLDEACCRCPVSRKADASYVAARNGGVSTREPQVTSRSRLR